MKKEKVNVVRDVLTLFMGYVAPCNGIVETYALYDATVLQWLTLEAPTLHETWLRPWTEKTEEIRTVTI